eukprot:1434418-Pyramimonas_sp.AAC.1
MPRRTTEVHASESRMTSSWTSSQTIPSRISLSDALWSYVFVELCQLRVAAAVAVHGMATMPTEKGKSFSEARR